MADAEHLHRELQGREHAVADAVPRERRHEIGDVADDEQLARMGIEDDLRRHPGIAAADDHDVRRLAAPRELMEAVTLGRHAPDEEIAVTLDETERKFRCHGRSCKRRPRFKRSSRRCGRKGLNRLLSNVERAPPRIMDRQDDTGLKPAQALSRNELHIVEIEMDDRPCAPPPSFAPPKSPTPPHPVPAAPPPRPPPPPPRFFPSAQFPPASPPPPRRTGGPRNAIFRSSV